MAKIIKVGDMFLKNSTSNNLDHKKLEHDMLLYDIWSVLKNVKIIYDKDKEIIFGQPGLFLNNLAPVIEKIPDVPFQKEFLEIIKDFNHLNKEYLNLRCNLFVLSVDPYSFESIDNSHIEKNKDIAEKAQDLNIKIEGFNKKIKEMFNKYKIKIVFEVGLNTRHQATTQSIVKSSFKLKPISFTKKEQEAQQYLKEKQVKFIDSNDMNHTSSIIISHYYDETAKKDYFLGNRGTLVEDLNKALIFTEIEMAKKYIKKVFFNSYANIQNWNFLNFDLSFNKILQDKNTGKSNLINEYISKKEKKEIEKIFEDKPAQDLSSKNNNSNNIVKKINKL